MSVEYDPTRIINMDAAAEADSSMVLITDSSTGGTKKLTIEQLQEYVQAGLSSVPTTVRSAMLALFEAAAYSETGLTDEIAVIESWAEQVTSISLNNSTISISGSGTSQLTATTVPAGSTVTWSSSDTAVATVSSSGLVTGVSNGTATITASAGDLNAKCTVTVSGFATLESISAVYTQSGTVYATTSLNDLKTDLVVTALYDDTTSATVASTDYTLSGTLTEGTSTVTVSYGGKTTTFSVTVSPPAPLYTLYQGSGTASAGNTFTISDGNHLSADTADNSRNVWANTSRVSNNGGQFTSTMFSVNEGDTWEIKVKNIEFTSNTSAENNIKVELCTAEARAAVASSGAINYSSTSAGTLEDVSATGTFESAANIGSVSFFAYRGAVFEYDFEVYINGTRYL